MPTYEYLCQTCSHRFETWQKMTDDPLTACPQCKSPIRRVLYPAGVVFKGSGFYKTDNRSSGKGAKKEKAAEPTTSESTSSSSDSSSSSSSSSSSGEAKTA